MIILAQVSGRRMVQPVASPVPVDYSNPRGQSIDIALNRLPASDRRQRIGALLTNPGGPGESGLKFAFQAREYFTPKLRERYDIVGMDPRGVGRSRPIACLTPAEAEKAQSGGETRMINALVDACKARAGGFLPFAGTDNTAREMDVVRAALGEKKLNYYGVSYGTLLGQLYAEQFPRRTGRMVLDSVADPTQWPGDSAAQALAFETALRVFVDSCLTRGNCALGSNRDAIVKRIDDLTTRLDATPLTVDADTAITGQEVTQFLREAMYKEEAWPGAEKVFAALFHGDGRPLAAHNQAPEQGQGPTGGAESDGAGAAIMCLHLTPEQRTQAASREAAEEARRVAPVFGPSVAAQRELCRQWPAASLPNAGRALRATGAPEILLVHNTYDAATPVAWARSVEGQLNRARLMTNTSGGHGFYTMGPCTKTTVDTHLLTGAMPSKGTVCHDRAPGVADPE